MPRGLFVFIEQCLMVALSINTCWHCLKLKPDASRLANQEGANMMLFGGDTAPRTQLTLTELIGVCLVGHGHPRRAS